MSKSLGSSPSRLSMKEVSRATEKQGIVSILGSDCERTKSASIRRTLSADMSSKKWLAQNEFFSPMKKIASSEAFPVTVVTDSEEEEEEGRNPTQLDVWNSIQSGKSNNEEKSETGDGRFDIWSSILSQSKAKDNNDSVPYILPAVKRSASSLSEKSLQICTESLGSETGSDGFSSETGDLEEEEQTHQEIDQFQPSQSFDNNNNNDYFSNYPVVSSKKSLQVKSFPPPLPSLRRDDGSASVHMRSHRENGRLVLEAVSVPSQNCFRAERHDGRLVLTLISTPSSSKTEEFTEYDEDIQMFNFEEEIEEEKEKETEVRRVLMQQVPVISSPLMVKKLMGLATRNTWPHGFNIVVKIEDDETEAEEETRAAQSLPLRVAASFNAYEYGWRQSKPSKGTVITRQPPMKNVDNNLIVHISSYLNINNPINVSKLGVCVVK